MALSSYDDLVSSIQNWMFDRPDLASMCGDFIALAEADMNQKLRTRNQLKTAALTVDGAGKASLPSDYLSFRQVTMSNDPNRNLELVVPPFSLGHISGLPRYFSIDGGTMSVMPASSDGVQFIYYAKIPPLSQSNPTNWLLEKAANLYLYGSCKHAGIFMGDETRTQAMGNMFASVLGDFLASEELAMYSRVSMRASGPTP